MRTTVNIEEELLHRLRRAASRGRTSLREALDQVLRLGLERLDPEPPRARYRGRTYHMGFPPVPNLNKALLVAATLEDEETARKLEVRK
jgi:hypothetical protein